MSRLDLRLAITLSAPRTASAKAGVRRIVRIMGKQNIASMQWNRTLRDTQGINAEMAGSVEEADRLRDGAR